MVKALGIDPGTKTFDLVLVEGSKVIWEKSIESYEVANNPNIIIKVLKEVSTVIDIIAGPSGYGTPVVCNEDILNPRNFAIEILLLSSEEDITKGKKRGEIGIYVYDALAKIVEKFWEMKLNVCYIPSIILLSTIPLANKINKLDMGTADKLAVTVLAIWDQSQRLNIDIEETNFILAELGFGYNAVIGVKNGKIINGYGGTLVPNGFLTIGPIDAEIVVAGKKWERSDVFYGGVSTVCQSLDLDKIVKMHMEGTEPCASAFEAMINNVVNYIVIMRQYIRNPREIILSGRLSRNNYIFKLLKEKLENIAPIAKIKGLNGAEISKEAAQGYAIIGEGIGGGYFSNLINYVGITNARGTVLDYVFHPRILVAKKKLVEAYRKYVRASKVKNIIPS